jgi:hypothetical protein
MINKKTYYSPDGNQYAKVYKKFFKIFEKHSTLGFIQRVDIIIKNSAI